MSTTNWYYDATPYIDGPIDASYPNPPAPPFQATPEWNAGPPIWPGPIESGINDGWTSPHSNAGDRDVSAFLVGPGTGHFGW